MSAYVGDSELFRDQFGTAEMREVFDDRMTVQKWLDTEVALARAEADLGIIPKSAANEIVAIGNAADYDPGHHGHGADFADQGCLESDHGRSRCFGN